LSPKSKSEEHLHQIHRANIEELKAMLKRERETSKRILGKVRRESKKKFQVCTILHPELAYFEALREAVSYSQPTDLSAL